MPRGRGGPRPAFPYLRILDELRAWVLASPEGTALSPESALAARHGVSRMTARKAVMVLREEGLVFVARGRGAFVARRKLEIHSAPPCQGFTQMMRQAGLAPSSRLLRFERSEADVAVANALRIAPGTAVFELERLRLADEVPMVHELTTLPVDVCPSLYRYNLATESLYRILAEVRGLRFGSLTEQLEAGLTGRSLARLMKTTAADPVLIARRVLADAAGRPVELTVSTYRGDRYRATYRLPDGRGPDE
jgi:GntR family transcriptional regulator